MLLFSALSLELVIQWAVACILVSPGRWVIACQDGRRGQIQFDHEYSQLI